MSNKLRVLVADDESTIRAALVALLSLEPDLVVVADSDDGHTAVTEALRHRPHVAVLDLDMPGMGGLDAVRELSRVLPECACVLLTGKGRPAHLRQALEAGALGFVVKGAPAETLADVIRRTHGGQRYVDPALAAEALVAPPNPLSERELDVLRLAALDLPTSVIARRTSLAPGTVRNYVAAATAKLGASSRAEAIATARAHGWIS
jgi:two-component system response regulator DesR